MEGDRFHLDPQAAAELCDENTIGVVGILGSTFNRCCEPIADLCAALDQLQERTGLDIPVHVDGASGAMIAPFLDPDLVWDFRCRGCPRSTPRATSTGWSTRASAGHCGRRGRAARGAGLSGRLGRQHAQPRPDFFRPGAQVVAQYYTFLRLGRDGSRAMQPETWPAGSPSGSRRWRTSDCLTRGDELPVFAFATGTACDLVRRLRRVPAHAGERLAGARVHLPGQPGGPVRPACGVPQRLLVVSPTCSSRT